MKPMIITLTGPSCAGKTYLLNSLLKEYPNIFAKLLSDTTREKRIDESEGDEYNFISKEDFIRKNINDEYCQTVSFNGINYGTKREALTYAFETGLVPIRIVEPTGIAQFRKISQELGCMYFSVYVDEEPVVVMSRWIERYRNEKNPNTEYYALRILQTIFSEITWIDQEDYDFYYNESIVDPLELSYALSRIASGNMPISTCRKIFPMPENNS